MLQYRKSAHFCAAEANLLGNMRLFCCALCLDRCEKCVFTLPVLSPCQVFAFDHCFWSMDESNVPKYAGESKMRQKGIHGSVTKEVKSGPT